MSLIRRDNIELAVDIDACTRGDDCQVMCFNLNVGTGFQAYRPNFSMNVEFAFLGRRHMELLGAIFTEMSKLDVNNIGPARNKINALQEELYQLNSIEDEVEEDHDSFG